MSTATPAGMEVMPSWMVSGGVTGLRVLLVFGELWAMGLLIESVVAGVGYAVAVFVIALIPVLAGGRNRG